MPQAGDETLKAEAPLLASSELSPSLHIGHQYSAWLDRSSLDFSRSVQSAPNLDLLNLVEVRGRGLGPETQEVRHRSEILCTRLRQHMPRETAARTHLIECDFVSKRHVTPSVTCATARDNSTMQTYIHELSYM